ncbi:hypothetical protein IE077_003920, partial [Cardiosporidium cionae]
AIPSLFFFIIIKRGRSVCQCATRNSVFSLFFFGVFTAYLEVLLWEMKLCHLNTLLYAFYRRFETSLV